MRVGLAGPNPNRRRGVTLLEMLVVVALVVLMMTILASIFQKATEAISVSRTYMELDNQLRQIDTTIRGDLDGVTASLTPPNDPGQNRGYFEYGENAPADIQAEDTDDYLAFTARAPEGQVFTGRIWVPRKTPNDSPVNGAVQPVTITSKFAEIIYFLRNGNLYRRVLLVAPERKNSLGDRGLASLAVGEYYAPMFGGIQVSWQGMNDISARPPLGLQTIPIPNTLGDLTNRENRAFRPRFTNDYRNNSASNNATPDGSPDDFDNDGLPDYYPTMYPNALNTSAVGSLPTATPLVPSYKLATLMDGSSHPTPLTTYDALPFPYIFPGAYSKPMLGTAALPQNGWIHSLDQTNNTFNHAPLDLGDTIAIPSAANQLQTWWGFPTWRETMHPFWTDPIGRTSTNAGNAQSLGLRQVSPTATGLTSGTNLLPPQSPLYDSALNVRSPYNSDQVGGASFAYQPPYTGTNPNLRIWQDDLILTNVRSFDVKAYDPDAPLYSVAGGTYFSAGYYDLGFGSMQPTAAGLAAINTALLTGTPLAVMDSNFNPQGFGHEGRIPPLTTDNRRNPSRPTFTYYSSGTPVVGITPVGDDDPGVIRLRRVWDSWSTAYTNAPGVDINLNGSSLRTDTDAGGNSAMSQPCYPSFPPPYPSPLKGLQIQIRVTDPNSQRIKVLTIRQDFTDKLN